MYKMIYNTLSFSAVVCSVLYLHIGHVDAGKSTLMGHLLYLMGAVSKKLIHKYVGAMVVYDTLTLELK